MKPLTLTKQVAYRSTLVCQCGAVMLEFAISMALFVIFFSASISFGMYIYDEEVFTQAVGVSTWKLASAPMGTNAATATTMAEEVLVEFLRRAGKPAGSYAYRIRSNNVVVGKVDVLDDTSANATATSASVVLAYPNTSFGGMFAGILLGDKCVRSSVVLRAGMDVEDRTVGNVAACN